MPKVASQSKLCTPVLRNGKLLLLNINSFVGHVPCTKVSASAEGAQTGYTLSRPFPRPDKVTNLNLRDGTSHTYTFQYSSVSSRARVVRTAVPPRPLFSCSQRSRRVNFALFRIDRILYRYRSPHESVWHRSGDHKQARYFRSSMGRPERLPSFRRGTLETPAKGFHASRGLKRSHSSEESDL